MAQKCEECKKYDWNDSYWLNSAKHNCTKKGEYFFPGDGDNCPFFDSVRKNDESYKSVGLGTYTPSGCYITTMVVDILGLQDNSYELNVLRIFRKNYMQKQENLRELLIKYDAIGPMIALMINNLNDKQAFAKTLFNVYIKGSVKLIEKGDYDNAIFLYTEMTNNLINYFGINYFIPSEIHEKFDKDQLGHGKISLKPIKNV